MSAVELPHVASARSSSSRGSLYSAGSSSSEKSGRSDWNQRSHSSFPSRAVGSGADDGSGEDDVQECDENEDGGEYADGDAEEEEEEEEEPQESSGGLWDEVESFLNRPSPSLSVLAKPEKKAASGNMLPTLKSDHQRRKSSEPESQSATRAATRPARSIYQPSSKPAASAVKAINPKLLQEAFAYAQKVALLDFDDDQQEQIDVISDRHHPLGRSNSRSLSTSSSSSLGGRDAASGSGASAARASSHGAVKKQSSSGVKGDEVKKKKSATKASVYGSGAKPVKKKSERRMKEAMQWDPSSAASAGETGSGADAGGVNRKNMDPQVMQSLVSNFQNGTTLDELRKELAASQQSMALSRQVLHEAAKSFFQPSR